MSAELWIAWRFLCSRTTLAGGSAPLALFGLCLGVASLVASMAVMSGFESTLQSAMSDITGHVQVIRRTHEIEPADKLEARLREGEPELKAAVQFMRVEALLARDGRLQGTFIQAVDRHHRDEVMNLQSRLIKGSLSLEPEGDLPSVLIGEGLAATFHINVGDHLKVVIPIADPVDPERFRRKIGEFVVHGILNLGKYEWNERYLLADLAPVQALAEVGTRYQGLLLRFQDAERARQAGFRISQTLGPSYFVADWRELNENLFEAVRLERVVIFFVVFIIVIVAAFNVASTLFVNVLRRTSDIALLKALGMSTWGMLRVFSFQGLLIGAFGFLGGTALGLLLCRGFGYLQGHYHVLSGAVYRVDAIEASVRFEDLAIIAAATLSICFLATLAPAWRGARLTPTEGLRNG